MNPFDPDSDIPDVSDVLRRTDSAEPQPQAGNSAEWIHERAAGLEIVSDAGGNAIMSLVEEGLVTYRLHLREERLASIMEHLGGVSSLESVNDLCEWGFGVAANSPEEPWLVQYAMYIEDICAKCLMSDDRSAFVEVSLSGNARVLNRR